MHKFINDGQRHLRSTMAYIGMVKISCFAFFFTSSMMSWCPRAAATNSTQLHNFLLVPPSHHRVEMTRAASLHPVLSYFSRYS